MTTEDASIMVVIDDERTFMVMGDQPTDTVYLRTADEAILWFADALTQWHWGPVAPVISQIWFDHDLGEGDDATKVARFLATQAHNMPGVAAFHGTEFLVHTQNPVGADTLMSLLKEFHPQRVGLPPLKEWQCVNQGTVDLGRDVPICTPQNPHRLVCKEMNES